jgi:diguanylate cyclase (GGDEF)-like protein/PAS domain S-box-containing protein
MTDVLRGQMDYIFFFFGLAFILLAPICQLLKRRPPPQPAWVWLGAFGAAHGVNEWLDLLAMTPSITPVIALIKLVLATLSFLFLLEFGRASMIAMGRRSPGRWVLLALLGLAGLGGLLAGLPGFSASSRYALALVGGLWAAGALYLASKEPGPGTWALQGAALGLLLYGLMGGLVVKPAPFFPASLINSGSFLAATGLPIQLVKGLGALWISACLCLFAQASLAKEADPRIRVWVRNLLMGAAAGVIILLVCGWLLTQRLGNEAFQAERSNQEYKGEVLQGVMLDKMAEADHLVAVMSGSPWVFPALATGQPGRVQEANEVLDRYSQAFPQSVCYLMDLQGVTIASSNRRQPDSFVGKSYAFRPYFQQASQGSPGRYWALGVTSRELGYYASAPVRNGGGKIVGVAVIKIPLTGMGGFFPKQALSFVIDSHGIVVLANRPGLVLQSLWPLSGAAREEVLASRQFGDGPFMPILTQEPVTGGEVRFQGERLLVLRRPFPGQDWSLVILSSMRPIAMARLLGIGITLLLCWVLIGLLTIIGMTIEATARIQKSERNYRDLYDRLRDGSASVTLEGRIVEFNPAFQEMLGYAPEEIYRLTSEDITPEKWHPLEAKIIEEQVFPRGYSDIYEKEYRRQDGAVIPVELQTYLVRDAAGYPAGLWAFVRDITHRKQIEANVLNEKILADTTIDSLPGIFYLFDQQGRFLRWNENFERATGYSAEEIAGMHPLDLFSGEDKKKVEERIREVFVTGEAAVEADLVSKDRGQTPYIFTGLRVMFDGTPYLIGTGTDISERRRAEDALRDSEQKFRLLVTDVPAMVYRGYADYSVDFFDDKIEALTGYPLEDFHTRRIKWSDLILAEDLEGAKEVFKQALKTDKAYMREFRIRSRLGTIHWIRERGKIVCDQDGRINHVTGVFSDITNQKAVDEALKNERDFTAALLDTVGALVVVLDREGRVVRFNHACELATGFLFDMVKGKYYWDLLLPAAEIESAKTYFQQLRAGNFPSCYESYWVSLDGNQRLINWTNTCLVGEDGTVQYIISTGIDITRRRQTEAALERLRLQNEMILSSAGQGIFGLDLEGKTTFINPAALEMTGYESGELLGQNIHEVIHYRKADGTHYPAEACPIYRTLRYGEVQRVVEDLFWTKAGQPLPVEYVTTPIKENGGLVGAVGVFRDITERKAWEEELQKANEQLKLLVAGVEERNRQMTLLNEMGEVLQACQSSEEAYQVIRNFTPKFFPTLAGGALYMLNHSQNLFQEVGVWGKSLLLEKVFAPDECWALRRGRLHQVDDPGTEMSCRHVSQPLQAGYLCVPLMAQSKAMGILYLQATGLIQSDLKEPNAQIAATLAEGIALALANLKLRETLQSQAIRDSLTGLFNRRYLEETLERELHRVKRLGIHLGVVMIDLDHFKQYNDNFGHNAGDELLVALGNLILSLVRAEDIPCRFGGEEFLLIIPGASLEVTLGRAEQLRLGVKQLHEQHPGKLLHPVTISAGVAVFPRDGASADVLIGAADAALYQAKREGRDRVVAADVDST